MSNFRPGHASFAYFFFFGSLDTSDLFNSSLVGAKIKNYRACTVRFDGKPIKHLHFVTVLDEAIKSVETSGAGFGKIKNFEPNAP